MMLERTLDTQYGLTNPEHHWVFRARRSNPNMFRRGSYSGWWPASR